MTLSLGERAVYGQALVKSRNPVRLLLLEEDIDEDDEYYDSLDNDLEDGRGYD
jgi:hypothetical protein